MGFPVQEITDLACDTFCFKEKAKKDTLDMEYLDFVIEKRSNSQRQTCACKFELLKFLLK